MEEARIEQGTEDPIQSVHLSKTYSNNFEALKNITFGVPQGKIFGLLGPNGAGKSTAFNILTSLILKSSGICKLKQMEVNRENIKIFEDVGVCPQFDCLWDNLSPKDHLYLFGRMKGLQGCELKKNVKYFLRKLQLQFYKNTKAINLSGGNKRKLCVAMSLIGGSDLLFFDEPSTGLDPIARKFLWDILRNSLKSRKNSIVFTTHAMSEAETLCDIIGN